MRMWGTHGRWLACAGLILASCAGAPRAPVTEGPEIAVPRQLQDRQLIVTLAPAPPDRWAAIREALARTYNLRETGAFPLSSLGIMCIVFQVPDDRPIADVIAGLSADPQVESVQVNQLFQSLQSVHADPYADLQYGAHSIRADLAHRWATGRGVKIALVDTGVDTGHPDLEGRIAKTATFVQGGEKSFTEDLHGTAVAGIIAADADNHVGIFGVAPEAQIMVAKACWHRAPAAVEAVCSSWALARAIDFAIAGDAQILNLSLGGPPDPLLARLIAKAVDRGATVVAAVMERGAPAPGFPASLDPVIAVIASDVHGEVRLPAGLARRGLLAAPGIDILTTSPHGGYDFRSGSSLAAAHVSGVAALLLERDPRLTGAAVRALLAETARPVAAARGSVSGVVDACAAVAKLVPAARCP
jgi:subtilisin family serine protease